MAAAHHVVVAGTHVEVEELGAGDPVVVVQTALAIDELAPLARLLSADFHVWHVHRPGYGDNGPARVPGSVDEDADLVAEVLDHLGLGPAHLVGASYSAAVALSLASRHPRAVRSLALVEPPPYGTARTADFRAANTGLLDVHASEGADAALERLMRIIDGPDWRTNAERDLPGSVATMERDAATFFGSDIPALLGWTLDDERVATVACPALLVGGSASHVWFAEMLERLERLLATTRVIVAGAGHSAALTHPHEVAAAVRDHVRTVSPPRPAAGRDPDRS